MYKACIGVHLCGEASLLCNSLLDIVAPVLQGPCLFYAKAAASYGYLGCGEEEEGILNMCR